MKMPFGAYRGRELSRLPSDYLAWLNSLSDLREPLRGAVAREYKRRFQRHYEYDEDYSRKALSQPVREAALEIVTVGYRVLARHHHPDHGGDTATMQIINEAVAYLREYAS